jgi:hypothetical protein
MEGEQSKLVCVILAKDERAVLNQLDRFGASMEENETCVETDSYGKPIVFWVAWPGCEHRLPKIIDALFVCSGEYEEYDSAVDAYAYEKLSHSVHIIYREQPTQSVFEPGRVKFVPMAYRTTGEFVEFLFKLNDELEEAIKRVFTSFDADNSGFIDSHELQGVSRELGKELTEEELKQVLNELDENRDGKISYEEFRNWWKSGRRASGRVMKKLTSLRAKAKKLINAVTASTEVLEDLYGKDIETLANYSITLNQGPEIEAPGLKVNVNVVAGESEERNHLAGMASLEDLEKEFFLTLTFKLQEGKDPELVKDKLNILISKLMLRFASSGGRSNRKLMKAIEYRLRSRGQFVHLYVFLNNESRQLAAVKSAWHKIKFAFPDTVEQSASVDLKLNNSVKKALEKETTPIYLSLLEHFRLNVKASIWSQITEYGQRIVEGMVYIRRLTSYKFIIIALALLLTKTEIQLNATTLTEFSDAIIDILITFRVIDHDDIDMYLPSSLLRSLAKSYRRTAKNLPIVKNILAFLRDYIDTELIQVFANFFKLSAKVSVEGEGILNLLPRIP